MNYSKALKISRAIAGLDQKTLAKRAKLNPSYISLIELGRRQPSSRTVERLARALGVPIHLLVLLASDSRDLRISRSKDLSKAIYLLAHLMLSGRKSRNARQV